MADLWTFFLLEVLLAAKENIVQVQNWSLRKVESTCCFCKSRFFITNKKNKGLFHWQERSQCLKQTYLGNFGLTFKRDSILTFNRRRFGTRLNCSSMFGFYFSKFKCVSNNLITMNLIIQTTTLYCLRFESLRRSLNFISKRSHCFYQLLSHM